MVEALERFTVTIGYPLKEVPVCLPRLAGPQGLEAHGRGGGLHLSFFSTHRGRRRFQAAVTILTLSAGMLSTSLLRIPLIPGTRAATANATLTVNLSGAFTPASVTINAGDTVTWTTYRVYLTSAQAGNWYLDAASSKVRQYFRRQAFRTGPTIASACPSIYLKGAGMKKVVFLAVVLTVLCAGSASAKIVTVDISKVGFVPGTVSFRPGTWSPS